MILSDYHMHSEFSSDSEAPMEQMIERAIDLGLKQICFTDHMDYDYPKISLDHNDPSGDLYLDFLFDPDAYFTKLRQLQETYANQIDVRIGIELGLQAHIQPQVKQLMEQYDFDFAIGSSHLLYGDDPYLRSFWEKLGCNLAPEELLSHTNAGIVKKAIHDYLNDILTNIRLFPWFQVYGHLDYIVRYAPGKDTFYQVSDHMEIIDEILKNLITSNRGIEINTSGLKNGLKHANPHTDILKRYRDLGGEIITVGSDAHFPEYIAYEFAQARDFLMQSGFRYYTTFKEKKPEFHKL